MGNWKATPRGNILGRSPTVRQFQDDSPTDPITAEIITNPCGLAMFRLFSVISLQQFLRCTFRNMLNE